MEKLFLPKIKLKVIVAIVILVVIAAGYFIFFFNKGSAGNIELLNLAKNYKFSIPEGYKVDADTNQKTLIIISKRVEQYSPNNYQNLLDNEAILVQSYTQFNKNDAIFEKYIRDQYKSDEQREIEIKFEEINDNKVATVKVKHLARTLKEYIKIINSDYPVLIVSTGPSEDLNCVVKSFSGIDERDQSYREITNQIRLIGVLLKVNMIEEIYSLFTENYKNRLSENDFSEIMQKSEKMLQRSINFVGGELNGKKKEFSIRLIMIDPNNEPDYRFANLTLKKEKKQWLIDEIEIPKDEPEEELPSDVTP